MTAPTTLKHMPALALAFATSFSKYTPKISVTALLVLTMTCKAEPQDVSRTPAQARAKNNFAVP
jgi:hypothetical protein